VPCRSGKILAVTLFLAGLILLRQGIILMQQAMPGFDRQTRLITENHIDPSALFYTEVQGTVYLTPFYEAGPGRRGTKDLSVNSSNFTTNPILP